MASTSVASIGESEVGSLATRAPAIADTPPAFFRDLAADDLALLTAPARTLAATDLLECQTCSRCAAMSSRLRPESTLSGASSTMRASAPRCANESFSLINSHALSPLLPPDLLWGFTRVQ